MGQKLSAFIINEKIIGLELKNFSNSQCMIEDGSVSPAIQTLVPPFLIEETASPGYGDLSDYPTMWNLICQSSINKDYCYIRDRIKEAVIKVDFEYMSDEDRDIVGQYCATDDVTLITYYVSLGMSEMEAQYYHLQRRAADVNNAAECYYNRLTSVEFKIVTIIHMGEEQAQIFNDAMRNFASDVETRASLGIEYGDNMNGPLDYIEGTGDYIDAGLKNYNITDFTACRKQMKDIFYYGYIT